MKFVRYQFRHSIDHCPTSDEALRICHSVAPNSYIEASENAEPRVLDVHVSEPHKIGDEFMSVVLTVDEIISDDDFARLPKTRPVGDGFVKGPTKMTGPMVRFYRDKYDF